MKWKKVIFGTVACLAAVIGGGLIGGLLGRLAAEGQMLAGGAIVAFYMLIGAIFGGAFAGFLSYRWPERKVGWLAVAMLIIAASAWLILSVQIKEREAKRAGDQPPTSDIPTKPTTPTKPVEEAIQEDSIRWITQETSPPVLELNQQSGQLAKGFGFVHVPFTGEGVRLLFYPDAKSSNRPIDSLLYTRERHQNQLKYAPSDFQPFYLKEDYDSMILRLLGVGQNRVLVELNEASGRRGWVDRDVVDIRFWPEFLAAVFAVFPLDGQTNPVRITPQDNASEVNGISSGDFLLPDKVIGDWIHINAMKEGESEPGFSGWIRWQRAGVLLVGWDYRL